MRMNLTNTLGAVLLGACVLPAAAQDAKPQTAEDTIKEACPAGCEKACCAEACADDCEKACCAQECAADCAEACCADLSKMVKGFKQPELWVGDKAPNLHLAKFVKGDSVQGFEAGRTYVVEFWATWCRPCIEAFPHLSKLQEEHADNVTFMGINIFDTKRGEAQGARVERVTEFVADQGDRMGYTVAIEDGEKMGNAWMKPSGQNSIPAAFIVDGEGKIAWIGHPMGMDKPLAQIAAGEFDREAAAIESRNQKLAQTGFQQFGKGITQGTAEEARDAYKLARAMARQVFWDEPGALNAMAWPVLDHPAVKHRDYEFALFAANRAFEVTKGEDPTVLDTFALAQFKTGDSAGAIKTQTRALELLEGDEGRDEMVTRLDEYKAAKP